jgi:TPR repeat protein
MRVWFLWAACLFSEVAFADLFTAQLAYKNGDYERAFKDYRELAELGQPLAQYNLAILYAKGLGVRENELNAYAWATLAAENGSAQGKALADQLRPDLAPGSDAIAAQITAPYSRARLEEQLLPRIEEGEGESARCQSKRVILNGGFGYPSSALARQLEGRVFVAYTVMPDGSSRNPRIFYAVPTNVFERTIRADILYLHRAADASAAPTECQVGYNFQIGPQENSHPRLVHYAHELKSKADEGDLNAAWQYGLLTGAFPSELNSKRSDAVPWFLRGSQSGSPRAQFLLGNSLLFGWGCKCEETKAQVWLRTAAAADQPSAQVTIAAYALRGTPDEHHAQMAATWLGRAAASGDQEGMFYYAALLAAAPLDSLRDPQRALKLLAQVEPEFDQDPTTQEIRAAAQAANGDYRSAVKSEQRAIGQAEKLEWSLAPLQERLTRYQAGQPWTGYLLSF